MADRILSPAPTGSDVFGDYSPAVTCASAVILVLAFSVIDKLTGYDLQVGILTGLLGQPVDRGEQHGIRTADSKIRRIWLDHSFRMACGVRDVIIAVSVGCGGDVWRFRGEGLVPLPPSCPGLVHARSARTMRKRLAPRGKYLLS